MLKREVTIIPWMVILVYLTMVPSFAKAQLPSQNGERNIKNETVGLPGKEDQTPPGRPVLFVKPREIDFGDIRPGEGAKGSFTLNNMGSGSLQWSTTGPLGWAPLDKPKLSGDTTKNQDDLDIHLSLLDAGVTGGSGKSPFSVQLIIGNSDRRIISAKEIKPGQHRESIAISSNGGTRTIFFRFNILSGRSIPDLQVEPLKVDFGVIAAGDKITRRIQLSNKGSESLKWNVDLFKKSEKRSMDALKRGRYVSFLNESIRGKGIYEPPVQFGDNLKISGAWGENTGYPEAEATMSMKYLFSGSGIALSFWRGPNGGKLTAYVDDKLFNEIDCFSENRERVDTLIAEGLMDMPHTLTLIHTGGRTAIEGVSTYGREVKTGLQGIIHIFPNSGVTTKETDYVNISINTERLAPGWYGEDVVIRSTGGEETVELSFEISADGAPRILDVYRYVKDHHYLYTATPQTEAKNLDLSGYRKEGIAFRLFRAGTPGTVSFYRWHHPGKKDHFYSYDNRGGGKSLDGYVFEGIIGNIATSRLTGTKELYRWFNPSRGTHFYTTDQNGEGHAKKGYRFEAIAGYVR